jgi:chromosome segregation ATPase
LRNLSSDNETKKDYESKIQDAEFKLTFYNEHGVDEKLKKQIDFEEDSSKCAQVISIVTTYLNDKEIFIHKYSTSLIDPPTSMSQQNQKFFKHFFSVYNRIYGSILTIKNELSNGKRDLGDLEKEKSKFETLKGGLKEEFADIERKLAEELKSKEVKEIRPDEFRELHKLISAYKQKLDTLDDQDRQRETLIRNILQELARLNDFWHEEYKEINSELKKVNESQSSLEIKTEYKGDKEAFISYLKKVFRGTHLRETTFTSLANEFTDFIAMYKEFDKVKGLIGNSAQIFEERFNENLSTLLTWQVPNRFIIEYRGKELKRHSLGQRASALILFVLSQKENDVIMIDQPEDDLDNQTIYEDVIKLIRSMKPNTQFIFATHNANFPVLGDAEQGISCTYSDGTISVTCGSIDCPELQQEIVDIMEGGEEAFNRRKKIYGIWKTGA